MVGMMAGNTREQVLSLLTSAKKSPRNGSQDRFFEAVEGHFTSQGSLDVKGVCDEFAGAANGAVQSRPQIYR